VYDLFRKKSFKFRIKELRENGEFTGLASVYGNEDLQGDIVQRGAFKRTIDHKDGEIPLLWQHDPYSPIGIGSLEDSKEGLLIHGTLNLEVVKGKEAYSLLKQGALKGLSIGYDIIKDNWENGKRMLKELKLHEVSLVTFPANPRALISQIKNKWEAGNMNLKQLGAELQELTDEEVEVIYEQIRGLWTQTGLDHFLDMGESIIASMIAREIDFDANDPFIEAVALQEADEENTDPDEDSAYDDDEEDKAYNDDEDKDDDTDDIKSFLKYRGLKAGRVLSKRNIKRLEDAIGLLQTLLEDAGTEDSADKSHSKDCSCQSGTRHKNKRDLDTVKIQKLMQQIQSYSKEG